jgi:SSS family solute:Na+ symporter
MLDSKYIPLFLGGFIIWMVFIISVGFFGSRGKRSGQKFLTGGSDMSLFLIFCTLGATIIGTGSSIGAIGDGFNHGWGGAIFGLGSALGLLLLSSFVPIRRKDFITMSEEAQYYYGGDRRVRQLMGFMMFVIEIIWIGNHVNGGSKYLSYVLGIDPTWCKLITVCGFGAYVFIGGYVAVVKADVIQFCAIIGGFSFIAVKALPLAGGYDAIAQTFAAAGKPGAMEFYGLGSYGLMAAVALIFSTVMGVVGTPTYRTRIYTSRDESVARRAFLGQSGMMFVWSFVTALIGMSAYAIMVKNGHTLESGDYAFSYMATNVLGPAIGLMFLICGMSATMSSGGSDAISGVTILLTDVIPSVTGRRIAEKNYALASRIALVIALTLAFVITLFVGDVIAYFQKVVGSLLPGVGVTMLLGRFWRRSTWQGAYASVLSGTAFGLVVLTVPAFADWVRLTFGGPAIPSTVVAFAAGVAVSLATPRSTASEDERQKAVFAAREGKLHTT